MSTSIGQFWNVFDVHRTDVNTSVTGCTSPDGFFTKSSDDIFLWCFSSEKLGSMFVRIMTYIVNDLHRIQCLTTRICWTNILTACTGGTRPSIDETSPRKLGVIQRTKGFEIQFLKRHWNHLIGCKRRIFAIGSVSKNATFGSAMTKCMCFDNGIREQEGADGNHAPNICDIDGCL